MKIDRVMILGAGGQLGRELTEMFLDREVTALDVDQLDITDAEGLEKYFKLVRPQLVINAAAFVDVDGAESNREAAYRINAEAAGDIANFCRDFGARLMHISTDYVFDGDADTPYTEDDPPAPINVYGASKLKGEQLIEASGAEHQILRTCGLYTVFPCLGKQGKNFTETVLKIAADRGEIALVTDEICTPTYARDLAAQALAIAESELTGIIHATNGGACSWLEFASEAFRLGGIDVKITPVSASHFARAARRPAYSVLENKNLSAAGLDVMPHWRDALANYMARRADHCTE